MNKLKNIYFIGIGGIGMSGIAIIAKKRGYNVWGSDISESYITQRLQSLGIKVLKGHNKKHITSNIDLVVMSSAIKDDNPELLRANELGICVVKRAKFLSMLSHGLKTIAVAGSHGKTTTTGMITSIFQDSSLRYTSVIGGISKHISSNVSYSTDEEYFIIEADESDGSFIYYNPLVAVVTNIDNDHLDFYKDMNNLKMAFVNFINKVVFYGRVILYGDDPNINSLMQYITSPYYTYGFSNSNDWVVKDIENTRRGIRFCVYYKGKKEDVIELNIFGKHNALNALASYIVARYLGMDRTNILKGLFKFKGMKRRIDFIGRVSSVLFYDDYAHHPCEIKNTIASIKSFYPDRRIIVIFQPHRYTRTKILYKDFARSFDMADVVYIMDIYPANESPIDGVSSDMIINEMKKHKKNTFKYSSSFELVKQIREKDIVISLGAGDVYKTLDEIKRKYEMIAK